MRRVFHIALLALFMLYSQSMLVMWSLYFVEQNDIVLYYESPGEQSGGLNYMHKLCDAQKGEHDGALSLLKIAEQNLNYVGTSMVLCESMLTLVPCAQPECEHSPDAPETGDVFRPPCC